MKWTMERAPLIWGVSTKPVPNRGTETSGLSPRDVEIDEAVAAD
jgi:hypothetical protein